MLQGYLLQNSYSNSNNSSKGNNYIMPDCCFVCYSTPNEHNAPVVDMEIAARCS